MVLARRRRNVFHIIFPDGFVCLSMFGESPHAVMPAMPVASVFGLIQICPGMPVQWAIFSSQILFGCCKDLLYMISWWLCVISISACGYSCIVLQLLTVVSSIPLVRIWWRILVSPPYYVVIVIWVNMPYWVCRRVWLSEGIKLRVRPRDLIASTVRSVYYRMTGYSHFALWRFALSVVWQLPGYGLPSLFWRFF